MLDQQHLSESKHLTDHLHMGAVNVKQIPRVDRRCTEARDRRQEIRRSRMALYI